VFTAAVVEALQTGAAGGSVGGDVTVDELFDAVSERLRDSGQRPVKSALHVEGRIRIASRPRGPVPPTATLSPRSQRRVVSPSVAPDPDWPALLGYFRDVVQAGMADFKLMPVSGGRPLSPRTDYTEWKRLLERAGVPERRLHDARHTAATVLLLLQIPDRTVMAIMGWSNTAMAARYQHIISAIRRDVATSVGGLLWKPAEPAAADHNDGETGPPASAP
jgi:hypothetical protein